MANIQLSNPTDSLSEHIFHLIRRHNVSGASFFKKIQALRAKYQETTEPTQLLISFHNLSYHLANHFGPSHQKWKTNYYKPWKGLRVVADIFSINDINTSTIDVNLFLHSTILKDVTSQCHDIFINHLNSHDSSAAGRQLHTLFANPTNRTNLDFYYHQSYLFRSIFIKRFTKLVTDISSNDNQNYLHETLDHLIDAITSSRRLDTDGKWRMLPDSDLNLINSKLNSTSMPATILEGFQKTITALHTLYEIDINPQPHNIRAFCESLTDWFEKYMPRLDMTNSAKAYIILDDFIRDPHNSISASALVRDTQKTLINSMNQELISDYNPFLPLLLTRKSNKSLIPSSIWNLLNTLPNLTCRPPIFITKHFHKTTCFHVRLVQRLNQ